jgi:hypothetical protein
MSFQVNQNPTRILYLVGYSSSFLGDGCRSESYDRPDVNAGVDDGKKSATHSAI